MLTLSGLEEMSINARFDYRSELRGSAFFPAFSFANAVNLGFVVVRYLDRHHEVSSSLISAIQLAYRN